MIGVGNSIRFKWVKKYRSNIKLFGLLNVRIRRLIFDDTHIKVVPDEIHLFVIQSLATVRASVTLMGCHKIVYEAKNTEWFLQESDVTERPCKRRSGRDNVDAHRR